MNSKVLMIGKLTPVTKGTAAVMAAIRKTVSLPLALRGRLARRYNLGPVASFLGVIWLVIFSAFVGGIFWVLWRLTSQAYPDSINAAVDLRWYLLTLAASVGALSALVAFPFALVRIGFTSRQTRTAEENLTTDLINKAVEGLSATKEVNRIGRPITLSNSKDFEPVNLGKGLGETRELTDAERARLAEATTTDIEWRGIPFVPPSDELIVKRDEWQNFAATEPNLEVRIGAILSLERIARQRGSAPPGGVGGRARSHPA